MILLFMTLLGLVACGGGGSADSPAAAAAATVSPVGATDAVVPVAAAVAAVPDTAASAEPAVVVVGTLDNPSAANSAPASTETTTPVPAPSSQPALRALQAPTLPRNGLVAADLAVLIAEGDATSEAIGLAYQQARGVPEANMIRVAVPQGSDSISVADFATLKAAIDVKLPPGAQATLVTWTQPSRVSGACAMGITSALAFGYSANQCGGCNRTQVSSYFDSDSTRPFADLKIRPSMMLGAATVEAAKLLINRGVAADDSQPSGTGYLVRTSDAARSVRYADYPALPAAWSAEAGLLLRYLDGSLASSPQAVANQADVMFYFTGLAQVPQLASNHFLPGAAADHLTSYGGLLPGGNGQMPATDWLAAGATASFGTVEEPCNYTDKFPKASVLIDHYLRGDTLIEAYWKSVAWPGQGLFVGEPLAKPWGFAATATIEGGDLILRTRALRRNSTYRVDWQAAGSTHWQVLSQFTAGQPRPFTWRVALPANTAGSQLRWVGPCPTQPNAQCVLGSSS